MQHHVNRHGRSRNCFLLFWSLPRQRQHAQSLPLPQISGQLCSDTSCAVFALCKNDERRELEQEERALKSTQGTLTLGASTES